MKNLKKIKALVVIALVAVLSISVKAQVSPIARFVGWSQIGVVPAFNLQDTTDVIVPLQNGSYFMLGDVALFNSTINSFSPDDTLDLYSGPYKSGTHIAEVIGMTNLTPTTFISKFGQSGSTLVLLLSHKVTVSAVYARLRHPYASAGTFSMYISGYIIY